LFMDPSIVARIINYYKRREIMEAIVEHARNKEIGLRLRTGGFAKRPQVLLYPRDVLSNVQRGVTSFHASEELWSNPLMLSSTITKREMDSLRIGWDLVLDIDCKEFEYSRIAAIETLNLLKKEFKIKNIWVKFSGNKGFHIGIAYESFPEKLGGVEVKNLFPDAPRRIALMIMDMIKHKVGEKILRHEKGDIELIAKKTGIDKSELLKKTREELAGGIEIHEPDIYSFMGKILNIDTVLIAPRHLYRMPYSLHESSWLVSVPIPLSHLEEFKKEEAIPEKVIVKHKFIERERAVEGEAEELLRMAMVYMPESEEARLPIEEKRIIHEKITNKIPEELFPPCIKLGLKGLPDGRKRFLFILINFLRYMNWDKEEIIALINKWNQANNEPLRESYVNGQIKYNFKKEAVLPPNCDRREYYKDIGICSPDNLCGKIRNPVSYARLLFLKEKKKKKKRGEGASV